jgi:NADH dehydrogenase
MPIFLTGSTGYVGGHVLEALLSRGHNVTCLVRASAKKKLLARVEDWKNCQGIRIVEGNWIEPEQWLDQVSGHDVLINTVGIIRESYSGEFEAVHSSTPIALFNRAKDVGVKRVIQISALGADETAQTKFHLSKREADRHLSTLNIAYLIMRPSFIYGFGASSMAMFSRLAALPVTPVPGDGLYRIQPIHVRDIVKAVGIAVEREDWRSAVVDVGGGQVLAFDTMLELLGRQLGKPVRHFHIPWACMEVMARTTDLLLGFGPINTEELCMLRQGNFCDNSKFIEIFGFEPAGFSEAVADAISQ